MGEIENLSEKAINNLAIEVKVRLKISQTIYDEDGYIEYEKSIKNLEWDAYFIKNEIKIDRLEPKKKKIIKIAQFNVYNILEEYNMKNMHPWICQTTIKIKNENSELSKEIEIGYVW